MTSVGKLWTPDILSTVVEMEAQLHSLQDFLSSSEVIDTTAGWRAIGMPEDLVAFANDAGGNLFCFSRSLCAEKRLEDAPVLFWDHEFNETLEVAPSFMSFLDSYVRMGAPRG